MSSVQQKNIIIVFTSVGADAHIGPDRYGLTVGGQEDNRTVPLSPSYNADGLRTQKTDGTNTYTYIYNGSKLTAMTKGSDTLYFTYDAVGNPLTVTYNGTVYYYGTNLQGDIAEIYNAAGTMVVGYRYNAYGELDSMFGSMASTLGILNPLRYRGYVYDTETELYYLQSRYYNPEWGRFINADAYAATGQGLLGNNMFAYCQNKPVLYADPSGFVIVLAPDATEEEIEEYERAIAYLKKSKTARRLIELLETSSEVFTITFVDNFQNEYIYESNTIAFDPYHGTLLNDVTSIQSPALALAHEMGHAYQDLCGMYDYINDKNLTVIQKKTIMERINVDLFENPIALELGEPLLGSDRTFSTWCAVQNSTYHRNVIKRPFWYYFLPWNLAKPS